MTPTLSLTEAQALTALRTFLIGVLAPGIEVIAGQDNRVPEPAGTDFVVMTPMLRERIETNVTTTFDGYFATPSVPGTRADMQAIKLTVQIDVHGPAGGDNAQTITTLFRSDYAVDAFAASGFDVTPLYTGEPHQVPFLNAEQQIEERWSIDAVMQCNPIVTTAQDFAAALNIGLIEVDATYPP